MTALLEFQRTMARAVMQPLNLRDGLRRGATGRGAADGIALVKPNSRLSSWERLEIYSRSYWSRVLDALGEDFPGVRAVVGAKRFDRLRRAYLADCPSESFTMRNLGKHLTAWMERNPALVGAHYEIAREMAELEWAEIESFDAAEHERLSPAEIAGLEPASTLRLQSHLRLMEAGYEVDRLLLEIRQSVKRKGERPRAISEQRIARARFAATPAASSAASSATPSAGPLYLAIHRFELVVHYKRVDAEMFRLLQALARGASIGDAVETAYAESALIPEECRRHVQESFALFAALGWFCNANRMESKERLP